MDGMAGMDGFNGQGTGFQGMTDGGMGAMNMGQYGAQGGMTAAGMAGMNGNMNMNMGDGSMTGNMNMNGMTGNKLPIRDGGRRHEHGHG